MWIVWRFRHNFPGETHSNLLKPVYSDLAANGKILLHMSGTAGLVDKANISDKANEIINKLDSNRLQAEANQLLIKDLQELLNRFDKQEFIASN